MCLDLDEILSAALELERRCGSPLGAFDALFCNQVTLVADDPHVVVVAPGDSGPAEQQMLSVDLCSGTGREHLQCRQARRDVAGGPRGGHRLGAPIIRTRARVTRPREL